MKRKGQGKKVVSKKKYAKTAGQVAVVYNQPRTGGFLPNFQGINGRMILGGETKTLDRPGAPSVNNFTADTGTTNVTLLNGSQVGAAYNNRIGMKIRNKSLYLNGFIELVPIAAGSYNVEQDYLRIMVVYDKQSNATLPNYSDIIQSIQQNNTVTSTALDNINLTNKDRFVVLMDERKTVPPIQIQTTQNAQQNLGGDYTFPMASSTDMLIHRYIPLKGLETGYKASTGGIGDITYGALLLVTQGLYAIGAQGTQLAYSTRVRFADC